MQDNDTKKTGSGRIGVEFTSRPLSGWGGLLLMFEFFEKLGVREYLEQALPDGRSSPNQVPVVDIAMALMATILTGGSRFAHVERVRADAAIKTILNASRMPSESVVTRYFGNFTQGQSEHMIETLQRLIAEQLRNCKTPEVLDLDSTVFSRYGDQEGSAKGYHPQRPGRKSHHPLLAMLAEGKLIVHSWLRSGSASPLKGCEQFLAETMARLPEGFAIKAVRGDAGFFSKDFVSALEQRGLGYVIAMKMSRPVKRWAATRPVWKEVSKTISVADDLYEPPLWGRARRVIVVRECVGREVKGVLFELAQYEYRAFVTNLELEPVDLWRFYNARGDCENRIKEAKYDFHVHGFCLRSFAGTDAVFRLNTFLYNLVSLFRTHVLRDSRLRLGTIRDKVFVVGAALGRSGRKVILRLGLTRRWKDEFNILAKRIAHFSSSTAAQLRKYFEEQGQERPSPWKLRPC